MARNELHPTSPTTRTAALAGIAIALSSAGCFGSRMGDAAVRLEHGQPCFGLAPAESRGDDMRLSAIILSDVSQQPTRTVWVLSANVDAQALPLPAGRCLRLDERPPGYEAQVPPNLELQRVYEVFVNASPERGGRGAQGFTQRFCLTPSATGQPTLQTLPPNASQCGAQ